MSTSIVMSIKEEVVKPEGLVESLYSQSKMLRALLSDEHNVLFDCA